MCQLFLPTVTSAQLGAWLQLWWAPQGVYVAQIEAGILSISLRCVAVIGAEPRSQGCEMEIGGHPAWTFVHCREGPR